MGRAQLLSLLIMCDSVAAPSASPAIETEKVPDALLLNALSPEEAAVGFTLLFDGKDLAGWKPNGKPGSFAVKDGTIEGNRHEKDTAYWLSTEKQFGDFELRLQYRIEPGGNSGIFIRAPHEGRTSQQGMEIQLIDESAFRNMSAVKSTGAIYMVAPPRAFTARPPGQWNDLWILCDGEHIRVTINGHVVNDVMIRDYDALKARPRRGYIGLSAHTKPVHFRRIRLRELPSNLAAPQPAR